MNKWEDINTNHFVCFVADVGECDRGLSSMLSASIFSVRLEDFMSIDFHNRYCDDLKLTTLDISNKHEALYGVLYYLNADGNIVGHGTYFESKRLCLSVKANMKYTDTSEFNLTANVKFKKESDVPQDIKEYFNNELKNMASRVEAKIDE